MLFQGSQMLYARAPITFYYLAIEFIRLPQNDRQITNL